MVLFFCVFLALRFEDLKNPVANIEDYDLHNESVLFAGFVFISTFLIQDSPQPDLLSMIVTSTLFDCSAKKTQVL